MIAEPLLDKLTEHGIAGIVIALLFVAVYLLNRQYNTAQKEHTKESQAAQKAHLDAVQEIQKLRVEDQKAHQTQLVDLIKACTIAITSGTSTAAAEKEALGEVRDSLEKLVEETRRNTPRRQQ